MGTSEKCEDAYRRHSALKNIIKDISKSVPFWPNSEIPIQKIPCFFSIVFGLFFYFFVGGKKKFPDMSSGLSPGVIWGPELSPRKSGRCARFARATPCQCREAWRFLPLMHKRQVGSVLALSVGTFMKEAAVMAPKGSWRSHGTQHLRSPPSSNPHN